MKRSIVGCAFLIVGFGLLVQAKHQQAPSVDDQQTINSPVPDTIRIQTGTGTGTAKAPVHKRLILAKDTLTVSDYMMSIDRVNDGLNTIRDSSVLGFEVVRMQRKVDDITSEISIIRKNVRGRGSAFSIKNLYLYLSFISDLNKENDRFEAHVSKIYHRVYYAKLSLKTVLSDSVFHVLYSDNNLRDDFESKLVRLERKWTRSDSTTKANIDTLNTLKIKIADNAVNLSNMLNIMEVRLDKMDAQLFGREENLLWQKTEKDTIATSRVVVTRLGTEKNAINFYFRQASGKRAYLIILGLLLFVWLFSKKRLLKEVRDPDSRFEFLQLQYLNIYPAISVFVLVMCMTPLFDAYAPASYIAVEYLLLLIATSVILFKRGNLLFLLNWMLAAALFIIYIFSYLFIEPTFIARLWLLALQVSIIVVSFLLYRSVNEEIAYYKWIKKAAISGMILSGLGILSNLIGRFSLSGIFGVSAIFAVTQAVVLPVFIETIIEIILLQLQSSRMKRGFDRPFDSTFIVNKIKIPLEIIALILWVIMLASNLNIYNSIIESVTGLMTSSRSIGSISFKLISVLLFFIIIWFAHILQRLIGFLFGETGIETEDTTPVTKKQHSRLLITRLLVLIGGYLLAISASGLPLDKITILLGALGIGIGMGLQNIVNNFVSGIILIFDGSLKIGDEIEVSGQSGRVKEIGLRTSTLSTADGAEVIIPNGTMLSQNIVNWTFTNDQKRVMIWFILSGKELDANVINEIINDNIINIPEVVSHKKPVILYTRATSDTCTLNVRFWSTIKNADRAKSDAILKLSAAFADKNIQFE